MKLIHLINPPIHRLKSTNEVITPLNLNRKHINQYLQKTATKGGSHTIIPKSFSQWRLPIRKTLLDGYKHFILRNGSIQLIHSRNVLSTK